ncbi:hypothetical protein Mal64_18040 [Pseudobythopirellula maris]|uniref:YrhK domain-containing protein n=1 Tax=Pseudobythopirellula maris TaxID=2527991 RepID=A0A5C5ZMH7_9BACT|nr:YrhK family protein [Pseudobythopirellula maris]TWT88325.1 hypothetical protein Mal64_18040 [Pseudobythopirellula maris]
MNNSAGPARVEQADDTGSASLHDRQELMVSLFGTLGNAMFLVGSVCFLSAATKHAGVWLFIVGSCLLLFHSVPEIVAKARRLSTHAVKIHHGATRRSTHSPSSSV